MIPLMMQEGYHAKGWLGLVLGSRMWYPFFPSAVDTTEKFESAMESLAREIGQRGKRRAATATAVVPASPMPHTSPADSGGGEAFSPSMAEMSPLAVHRTPSLPIQQHGQQDPPPHHTSVAALATTELTTMVTRLMQEQRDMFAEQRDHEARVRHELETQHSAQMDTCLDHQREALAEVQLSAFQMRLDNLRAAELLSDEDLCSLEDAIADFLELRAVATCQGRSSTFGATAEAIKIHAMMSLSQGLRSDEAVARQLKRKFVLGTRQL
eukprot:SAG31_NODE_1350_length_8681_cov_14.408879_2_plen_268_part_00